MLARLSVGAKLMLLVVLPVGVLLAFTIAGAVDSVRKARSVSEFQRATEQSFVAADIATAVADERTAAAEATLRAGEDSAQRLASTQSRVDAVLAQANAHATTSPVDLPGRLDATRRQLNAVRVELSSGSLTVGQITDKYSAIVDNLFTTTRQVNTDEPTPASTRAADAYLAIAGAIEAASREQIDVAALLAKPDTFATSNAARWSVLEAAHLGTFRENTTGPLAGELQAVQFSLAGVTVTAVRDQLSSGAVGALRGRSLAEWLDASGTRIGSLRDLRSRAQQNLATTAREDLAAAREHSIRGICISLAVVLLVTALALALRRSITRPLSEVAEAAQSLSRGDLAVDVGYRGRDEIGQVAMAFRKVHDTAARLSAEISQMTTAVSDNRLDHRADAAAVEGTWSQLLAGLNNTMAAFADVESRRERAERELADFFDLSLDLFCIGGPDGTFTRVNRAFEQDLGYSAAELTSRPFVEFIHPDDRQRTAQTFQSQMGGDEVVDFENRYICADGSVRWLQWTARAIPTEGFACAVARDVTERRRSEEEQAALRRVATLVAEGASPTDTFSAVAAEAAQLWDADVAVVFRYEPYRQATILGGWSVPGIALPVGSRVDVTGEGVAVRVLDTGRPARTELFQGPPGSIPAFFNSVGARSGVGAPITVEGQLWGVLVVVAVERDRLPAGSEIGAPRFTDLLATAISNAEARHELRRVADEQAALRRVATLVAAGAQSTAVFTSVAEEAGRLLDVDHACLARYDSNNIVTTIATWQTAARALATSGWAGDGTVIALVRQTGHSMRIDRDADDTGAAAQQQDPHTTVGAPIIVKGGLWGVIVVASMGEKAPPETEPRLGDFTELVAIAIANAEAQAEVAASRARIIAAADQTRRRIERDLHDGAQQRLVSLALQLRTAQAAIPPGLGELGAQLNRALDGLRGAMDELRELARGIHPAILASGGLRPALRTLARQSPIPVEVNVGVANRLPEPVEVAAYYVVAEALTNAAKYSSASQVHVDADITNELLCVRVRDDGGGGADPERGSGLRGLKDRVEALAGTLVLHSPPGAGTELNVKLPLNDSAGATRPSSL
jgi:PAS domain S-box-containing protein